MRMILTVMMLIVTSHLFGQGHDVTAGNCVNYVPDPPKPGQSARVTPDAYFVGCTVCTKAAKDKYDQEVLEARERAKAYHENIMKQKRDREIAEEKRQQDLQRRENAALAELNNLKNDNEAFDRMRAKERARKEAINAKFNEEMGRENRAYQDHLSKLQEAASLQVSASNDPFWNETVMTQNFVAYRDEKKGTVGFKDRKGTVVISPKYDQGLDYSGGITMIRYGREQKYRMAILNTRGETIKEFGDINNDLKGQSEIQINGVGFPRMISDGIIFLPVSVRNPDYQDLVALMNKEGRLITSKLFYRVEPFRNGLAKASRLISKDEIEFEEFPRDYYARFFYLEEGLIDKKGNWAQSPQKKLEYSYWSSGQATLTIESEADRRMTAAERKLQDERVKRQEKIRHDAAMSKLESQVNSKVSSAKTSGYLIENLNSKK